MLNVSLNDDVAEKVKIMSKLTDRTPEEVVNDTLWENLRKIEDVPDDVDTVVDGTIKGEVWFEDSFVDEVIFPLPLYGIPSNITEEVTLDGMCGRSVEYDGKYTVKITDNQNLWIMEA